MQYSKKIIILFCSQAFFYACQFLLIPIFCRGLGIKSYGVYTQITGSINFLLPFALLALPEVLLRFIPSVEDKEKKSHIYFTVLFNVFLSSIIIACVFFLLGGFINKYFIKSSDETVTVIYYSVLLLLFQCLSLVVNYYFKSVQNLKVVVIFQIFQALASIIIVFFTIIFNQDLKFVFIGFFCIHLFIFIIGQWIIQREISFSMPQMHLLKKFIPYSLPLFIYAILEWVVNASDRYVIGYYLKINEVGNYSVIYSVSMLIMFIYAPFFMFITPKLSHCFDNKDFYTFNKVLYLSNKIPLIITIPVIIFLTVNFHSVYFLITGGVFTNSPLLFFLISTSYVFYYVGWYYAQSFYLLKKTKYITYAYVFAGLINLFINISLVPHIGITGASISNFTTFFFLFLYYRVMAKKHICDFKLGFDYFFKIIISTLIMGAVIFLLNFYIIFTNSLLSIAISLIISVIVYYICGYLLGLFSQKEIKSYKEIFNI
jgi:O-antigen/teichoic acid export membrane protein